jgi:co-chaperonin GroES (HSP10)
MLQALGDKVIIEVEYETKSTGGVIIPESAQKFKLYDGRYAGRVVSLGRKCPFKADLKPGDKIFFVQNEGYKFYYKGKAYFQLGTKKPRDWVLAKLAD